MKTDNTGFNALLEYSYQHLNIPPDNEAQHKSYILWSYGNEPTHFFIKDLQNDVKPQINTDGATEV